MLNIPIIENIVKTVGNVAGKFITDKDKLNELTFGLQTELLTTFKETDLQQIEMNKTETTVNNKFALFTAGWRPAVGWICALAIFYNYIIAPMFHQQTLNIEVLMSLLFGMLGLSGMRTFEKYTGVEGKR